MRRFAGCLLGVLIKRIQFNHANAGGRGAAAGGGDIIHRLGRLVLKFHHISHQRDRFGAVGGIGGMGFDDGQFHLRAFRSAYLFHHLGQRHPGHNHRFLAFLRHGYHDVVVGDLA